jgi:anti-sigma factor ChrR (cupin superfamily)
MSSREKGEETNDVVHRQLNEEAREFASLHSLGLLEAAEAARWESHLGRCPVCAAEMRACAELVAGVTQAEAEKVLAALPESQPPRHLKEKLMRQIAASPSPAGLPNSLILRADEGRWRKILPGIEVKALFLDPIAKTVTSLVRVAAGAVYPAHIHMGVEHLYVLDGEIVFEDHTLSTGDYEMRPADSTHSSATTTPAEGCLLLVINSGHDQFLP